MTIIIVISTAIIALALWTGSIGVHFSSVDREDNPVLYWAQIGGIVLILILAIVVRVRVGD